MPVRFSMPSLLICAMAFACDAPADDPREAQITAAIAHSDEASIRTRPALIAGKWSVMSNAPIDFFRGTLPIYADDWEKGVLNIGSSRFMLAAPLVPSVGDAHPENFGTMRAPDGTYALEPNDFDSADRAPYLWDVRRLATGMALAARAANSDDATAQAATASHAHDIARAAVTAYLEAIRQTVAGNPIGRIGEPQAGAIVSDLFKRSHRDEAARAELPEYTTLNGNVRRLIRGVIDPATPDNAFGDLPADAMTALPQTLSEYRATLIDAPDPPYFTVIDAVREFGAGVASWPKVRVIILVRGPSDDPSDDVLLELKELTDSTIAGLYPPGRYADNVDSRVIEAARAAWDRPDAEPLWGVSSILGIDCQIKNETESFKTIRVAKLVKDLGTTEALTDLATTLGMLIARVHTTHVNGVTDAANAIWKMIGADPSGFENEQADVATTYAAEMFDDQERFRRALAKLGPSLGIPFDAADAPTGDIAALYGSPPPSPAPASP